MTYLNDSGLVANRVAIISSTTKFLAHTYKLVAVD